MWSEHAFPCGCWYFEDEEGRAREVEVCRSCMKKTLKALQRLYDRRVDKSEEGVTFKQERGFSD